MYIPKPFRVDDVSTLRAFMEAYNFATVISDGSSGLVASHLPLLVNADDEGHITLLGHMARANSQWRDFEDGVEVLATFHGPHGYVTPRLYDDPISVPTWNYMVVHAYGNPRLLREDAAKRNALAELVEFHEAGAGNPWRLDLPEDYLARMTDQIVAFQIVVDRLEGKFKLSQNRPSADRLNVAQSFEGSDPMLRALGQAMRNAGERV